ncbi:similar to Saccharomyces cerevisiae YJR140C HIR3 Subunit of the HIR complex [Maudiozyma saulgeensis]|uniref:Similar to Saccharomyces cerevisiae YJR140C HIR3 Subunit of the HIR complex n=1 Tax=Maudiozyma saulgeensis TaxID=1789683 RepID=A0A1X7R8N9_9SACH|nr:similar to Saccharomyces cerevisiae YJR140C HIR3 Subunit of the HIR complex [Kazachstania saulgeensis]
MSSFNAINLAPQDDEVEAEEHTRELQIQEGFKIYEEALLLLNEKKFDKSNEKFEELFKLDVIVPDKWGIYRYSSPILDRLRYLTYRNRGMYYYTYILENHESLDRSDVVNNILKVVENLIEAIQHDDPDIAVTNLLVQLFRGFKSKRLERLILECELSKNDNQLLLTGRRRKTLLPQIEMLVNHYCSLLTKFDEDNTLDFILAKIPTKTGIKQTHEDSNVLKLNPILDKIKKMKTEDEDLMKSLDTFAIDIKELDWENVVSSLSSLLPYAKTSNLLGRNSDPYNELEEPIEAIEFVVKPGIIAMEQNILQNKKDDIELTPVVTETILPNETTSAPLDAINNKEKNIDESDVTKRALKRSAEGDSAAARIVQRASKRFKERDTPTNDNKTHLSLNAHEMFLDEYGKIIAELSYKVPFLISDLSKESSESNKDLLWYYDLLHSLDNWNSTYADIFTRGEQTKKKATNPTSNRDEILQLNVLLKTNILEEKNDMCDVTEKLISDDLEKFIAIINSTKPHFHEARFSLLKFLLGNNNGERFVTKFIWSSTMLKAIVTFVLGIERNLYEFIVYNKDNNWCFGLSILEILVNFLGDICEEMRTIKTQSNKMNDLKSQRNKLERKIDRWFLLLEHGENIENSAYNNLQLEWIRYCYIQITNEITSSLLFHSLETLSSIIKKIETPTQVNYPNYKHIPTLSSDSVRSQLSKINIIRNISLTELNENDSANQDEIERENLQHMQLLESILVKSLYPANNSTSNDLEKEMINFISESPFNLQAKLWEVLFLYYCNLNDVNASLRVYFNYIHLLRIGISTDQDYTSLSEIRVRKLLFILSAAGSISLKMLEYLKNNKWDEPKLSIKHEAVQDIYQIFFVLYSITYYETISSNDPNLTSFSHKAVKSYALVKDYLVSMGTILVYLFCWECYAQNIIEYNDFTVQYISLLHSFFGAQSFCDSANGFFLLLSENLLCRWAIKGSYDSFKQVLWCRYHYLLNTESGNTETHETQTTKMNKENAIPLGIYLMRYQFKDSNPLLTSSNKSSIKQILDNIIETVGDPIISDNHILGRNEYLFNNFLSKPITISLLQRALNGSSLLTLTTPNDDLQCGMDAGIFYVASIQTMNLYKIKKKAMQARPSELDSIRRSLRNDILYNTKRFESWYLLGTCFSYIVEDDLIWTSDKISVIEKKRTTADTQRKAILCYIMALSLYFEMDDPLPDETIVIGQTFEALGNELISAYYKPMDKISFSWNFSNKILQLSEDRNVAESQTDEYTTISNFNVEQAIVLCFMKANHYLSISQKPNWWNDYNLSKMLFKINKTTYYNQAYNYILKAAITATKMFSKSKDAIIEPHFYLINICYKMVSLELVSPCEALGMISKDNRFFSQNDEFWILQSNGELNQNKKQFYQKVITLLRHTLSEDKKKLQHRPQFRIAKILYDEFRDTELALKEMENMVSIKNSKNLINIWKPDFERPGKHFVYAYEYVMFYIKLCLEQKNFNAIAIIIKKLRRFGSGIAYVNDAIDSSIRNYNLCIEKKLEITDKKYIENLFLQLSYQTFLKVSKKLFEEFDAKDYTEEYIDGLRYAFQLKKGNNGIAFDNVCLSIYFKCFYLPKLQTEIDEETGGNLAQKDTPEARFQVPEILEPLTKPESKIPTSPKQNGVKKRISKKEAFDRIRSLVDKFP